jgi:hypothetical protein
VVLKENPPAVVENQQLRKIERKDLPLFRRWKSSNELFSCCRETFRLTGVRMKKQSCPQMVQRGEEC